MGAQVTEADLAARDILDALSALVLSIGGALDRVYREPDGDFDGWVLTNLPFQPRTAERVRAMWLVWSEHPSDELPEPWKALWSLD